MQCMLKGNVPFTRSIISGESNPFSNSIVAIYFHVTKKKKKTVKTSTII